MQKIVQTKKQKGITLVALIITIIIMLILAGIAINMIVGDNGIFKKSEEAKQIYTNEQEKEKKGLDDLYSQMLIATNEDAKVTISVEELKSLIDKRIVEKAYPVGSIYISTEATNPSEILGGQWESYGEGRTLIGAGTGTDTNSTAMQFEANTVGGEYNHKLTIEEMPNHRHAYDSGGSALTVMTNTPLSSMAKNEGFSHASNGWWNGHNKNVSDIATSGGDSAHNNIQPYIVTYMWKRIS